MADSRYQIDNRKIGRNEPCPCGSGKKYKQCCGQLALSPISYSNLGYTLLTQGKPDEAIANYRKALAINPDFAEAHNDLGIALQEQGKLDEAVASYRMAISLKTDFAWAHNNLGNALQDQGKIDEATASYQRALSLQPDYAEAHNNLGFALQDQSKLDDAVASYRQALLFKPDFAEAHNNLGNALKNQGKLDAAVASYQSALSCLPDYAEAHNNMGLALQDQGRLEDAIASYRKALRCRRDFAEVHSNLLYAMQFLPAASSADSRAESARFTAQFEAPLKTFWRPHQNTREPGRRLKVGYLSPDFRHHAVAVFIEPVLANHDKLQIEVFCYYNLTAQDEHTRRLTACADHWLNCKSMTDEQLAARMGADGIDILVDLAGHTAHNRMLAFARKPVPIQITYLGYPGTSGLAAMDYRLTDGRADPAGSEALYTEKLLRLPDSLWCYRPPPSMPAITALPAQRNGYVTFGSFNNVNKIDRRCVELWTQLLQAVPASRLLIVTVPEGESRQRLTKQFAERGIAQERLEFHGKLAEHEFHRMLQRADITLDPVTVNGATTTCESLWLGVPVISLVGARFLERAGCSILSAAGLHEFAAATPQEYVKVAVRYANNLPQLAEVRNGLRSRMTKSPLVDEVKFTRNLEKIYRGVWTEWCSAAT